MNNEYRPYSPSKEIRVNLDKTLGQNIINSPVELKTAIAGILVRKQLNFIKNLSL